MGDDSFDSAEDSEEARSLRFFLKALAAAACLGAVVALFYVVENWRGKRVWERYKKELEAKGEHLDLDAFIPESIPDEENVLKAPVLSRNLHRVQGTGTLVANWMQAKPSELPEWSQIFEMSNIWERVVATGVTVPIRLETNALSGGEALPLIVLEDAPLTDAIRTLAQQGDVQFNVSPEVKHGKVFNPMPNVTVRFDGVSARQALGAVLDNHGLMMIPSATNQQTFTVVLKKGDVLVEEASTNARAPRLYSRVVLKDAVLTNVIQRFAEASGISFKFNVNAWKDFGSMAQKQGINMAVSQRWDDATSSQILEDLLETHLLKMTTNVAGNVELSFHSRTGAAILKDFEEFDSEFEEIYAACARPKAKFDFNYKDLTQRDLPKMFPLRMIAQALGLRASAQLAVNQSDAALRNIQTCFRLADCLTNEPTLIGGMFRVAIHGLTICPTWEGLAARRWNEKQLSELQQTLARIDLLSGVVRSIRGTRARDTLLATDLSQDELSQYFDGPYFNEKEEEAHYWKRMAIRYVPHGWIYQNLVLVNHLTQEQDIEPVDLKESFISPSKVEAGQKRTDDAYEPIGPGNFLASITYRGYSRALRSTALNQTGITQAVIACALERYRLAHGTFPDKLDALTPRFLTKIPHDVVNGQPMKYRLTDDGQYILYSIGWNEKDDGGKPAPSGWSAKDPGGDWVWRFPTRTH